MKKKRSSHLSLLITLLLVSLLLLFQFSASEYRVISFGLLMISAIAMQLLSSAKNFIWLLAVILGVGFGMLFLTDASIATQLELIESYTFLVTTLIIMWLLFGEMKKADAQVKAAQAHAKELEKYIGSSDLLTYTEFVNRVDVITTGTKRRGEVNYYLHFQLKAPAITQTAFDALFCETLLATVRTRFDLVTKLADDSYLVFLQHTEKAGCMIVLERFFSTLKTKLETDALPVEVDVLNEKEAVEFVDFPQEGAVVR